MRMYTVIALTKMRKITIMFLIISATAGPILADTKCISTHVGGYASLDISGAKESQCKTNDGRRVAECYNGKWKADPKFSGRINGSCDRMILGPVENTDFELQFICDDLNSHENTSEYRLTESLSEVSEATSSPAGVTLSGSTPISSQSEGRGPKGVGWGVVVAVVVGVGLVVVVFLIYRGKRRNSGQPQTRMDSLL